MFWLAILLLAFLTPPVDAQGRANAPLMGVLQESTGGGLCLIRRATDLQCGTCGMTRAFVQLAHGSPLAAFWLNPLAPLAFIWLLGRLAEVAALNLGKRLDLGIPNRVRWSFYAVGGLVFILIFGSRLTAGVMGLQPPI